MLKKKFKLSTIITSLVCLVVLVSLLITDVLISTTINEYVKENLEKRAATISKIVANSQIVKNGLKEGGNVEAIQPYAIDIQKTTDVLFVVVMDMNGYRKSHPNPERIGQKFVGGDEKEVLKGKAYVSFSEGTLGKSYRAFTPVYDENNVQIGAVAVGIALTEVDETLSSARDIILLATIIGILFGIVGALIVAGYIRKTLFGLEPFAIAKILEERNTMLQSVHEGIVAVDQDFTITLVNKSARRILKKAGITIDPIGVRINELLPAFSLDEIMKTGAPELNGEHSVNGVTILVNKVPLIVDKQVVGAISTFRDKTEINQLAEQLTGVKTYAETLRAQSHEFMNKLHVILGMVRMGMYDELADFISTLVNHINNEVGNVTKSIKDPAIAGFILGKLSYAREENVNLLINTKTVIPGPINLEITHEVITILGNLIDNAIEAMENSTEKNVEVTFNYIQKKLEITVADTGSGIPSVVIDTVFEKGYSTKGQNRGYGLYLVRKSVEKLGGKIRINTESENGTVICVEIPIETQTGGEIDD
ncbi:DcuS/MalK family sensor histidine kinase [Bacillus sp. Marseille-P3661]|uniref:DcuS/MalK family sensor histidine kinase n=1 Tax=Bacillus sp. Marseille-P3661 TaxID=1936234 RepID=UPI000C85D0B1|nr:DcuS/MalK family sensor histidine kinase [Bacillus sp. Marseille-P3661]